ncbi:MAG: dicarboxylate/amino acid:cation symporter [Chromatiales bacterium]|nr:dicarboxylate/amino acid:cation symporter [Chromatiales bacterium]
MTERSFDHQKLSNRILIALVLGLLTGVLLNVTVADQPWVREWLLDGLFRVVGEGFVRFLSMLVVPIVFVSLITGVSSLSDPATLGRVGGKAIGLYMVTTGIAITLALLAATLVQPGVGANPEVLIEREIREVPPFTQVLIDMVPRNPVEAMAQGAMLPTIVFAILLGLAISFAGEPGSRVASFFRDFNEVIMRLVGIVMLIAPYGVFALIATLGATTGLSTFAGVLKYVLLVLAMLIVHATVVYPLLLKLLTGLSPIVFYRQIRDPLAFAFSTASSGATIPVTLRAVQQRLGVSNRVSSFTVPLGATINMDGTAIMQGIATGFIAQYFGVDLSFTQYLMVVLLVILASVGTAGVPGVGLVLLAGVLVQVGLPVEGIALILGVDRILDMTRTAVNVTGDALVSTVVARSEGEFDEAIFLSRAAASP